MDCGQAHVNRGLIPGEFLQKIFSVLRPALFAVANENKIFYARAHVFIRVSVRFFRGFVAHFAEMATPAGSEVCDAFASVVQHAAQQTLFNRGLITGEFLQIIFSLLGPALFVVANKDKIL